MEQTAEFEQQRPRLLRVAARVLNDPHEAEDVVQNAWLRMDAADGDIDNLPGWLTTVTTRLCLDRLRARIPVPEADVDVVETAPDASEKIALAETVGVALHLLLDRLTPTERVAFVLHDSFGFDFHTIAEILGRTPVAARKLASRARSKVAQPTTRSVNLEGQADWQVVDAFLAAARNGDFTRLLELLAPNVVVEGDPAAVTLGTPDHLEGAEQVARFFNGAAKAAFPVYIEERPGAAWIHRGEPKVVFDFRIDCGMVQRIDFRAEPRILKQVQHRQGQQRV
ncbi:sigma-70 family RNA polymerase sigma factor [Alpinimonas psychrophila]|uniref:RNA polymerase sigma-70 factor (ECF subfamily) n=1 Tax=Alpinimonas psychrophila TaxID=748908 RepID=A0A7W3JSG6_9MICO|nr:sigma-70 family RNA polymerase sigma factor [Alpinimonas psychrophila]MBA8828404.1 RNA polymerase sigma-70 factor (ECF subfamily) [Alpinimonas psychrophila]